MKYTVLAAFAALASQADAQAFCGNPGVALQAGIIKALGPLAGTNLCYSVLNVPKTTRTRTITTTISGANAGTSTITSTTTTGTITSTSTITSTIVSTTSSASSTTTVTSATRDAPAAGVVAKKHKRQSNAKGKTPGNQPANNNAAATAARSSACSCVLGNSPTQTILFSTTKRTTLSKTITSTLLRTTALATTTSSKTVTTTSTTTTANGLATATVIVHYQKVYPVTATDGATGSGQKYNPTDRNLETGVITEDDCLDTCAQRATCMVAFFETRAAANGGPQCFTSDMAYDRANLVADVQVTAATGFKYISTDAATAPTFP